MKLVSPYYQDDAVTIYHGNCREILPNLPPVDLVLTDPPYGLMAREGKVQLRGPVVELDYGDWDKVVEWEWVHALRATSLFAFHDQRQATRIVDEAERAGFHLRQFFFWDKGDSGLNPRRNFVNTVEMAVFLTSSGYVWNGGGSTKNIYRNNRQPTPLHPTQKPIRLFRWLIGILSDAGQVTLDPFMGSGTTLRAAKDLGRKAIGIEIEERYCEVAANRMSQMVLV